MRVPMLLAVIVPRGKRCATHVMDEVKNANGLRKEHVRRTPEHPDQVEGGRWRWGSSGICLKRDF
jgi:hypothetical protein